MSALLQKRGATIAELLAIPEEDRHHELIAGELSEKAAPSGEHGATQAGVVRVFGGPFDRRPGGAGGPGGWWFATEVEIRLGEDVCRPDVVGWRRDRVPTRPRGAIVEVRPDWVCEILSTSDRRRDLVRKKQVYHRHQVGHYWIADPGEETLAVYRWHPDGYLEVLVGERGQRVRAEPFDALTIEIGVLFGAEDEEAPAT
jgi:Uma2 family endonuclease